MEDDQILALYQARDEAAIVETQRKYGRYCFAIANNILQNSEDAEECVNDAFRGAWDTIPPSRPTVLATYLGKITRQTALNRLRHRNAEKRGGGETAAALEELGECVPSGQSIDEHLEAEELTRAINAFLAGLTAEERRVFLRRYWYFDSISAISTRYGFRQSKVKMMLKRTRDKLLRQLKKEDIWL